MKAAVMYAQGDLPRVVDFPEPVVLHDDEVLVRVKAVAIKHLDKGQASGRHYSGGAPGEGGRVVGGDGVGLLADGSRVYGMGVSGMLAERATMLRDRMVRLPAGVSDVDAAALANAVMGSAMGLRFRAGIVPGDVVLVNGATGFTGRVAVQIAKFYGAGRVIATGRNVLSLQELLELGADEVIAIAPGMDGFVEAVKAVHARWPIDVVVDYLWGQTAEMILGSLMGDGSFSHRTRFVSVGSMTGDLIQLSAANLRSVDLQLMGSGLGSWRREQVRALFAEVLPEMFQLAADGRLVVKTTVVGLADVAELWALSVPDGQRLVVTI